MRTNKETKDLIKMYKDLRLVITDLILAGHNTLEYSQALNCINSALSDLYADLDSGVTQTQIDRLDRFELYINTKNQNVSKQEYIFNKSLNKAKVF